MHSHRPFFGGLASAGEPPGRRPGPEAGAAPQVIVCQPLGPYGVWGKHGNKPGV